MPTVSNRDVHGHWSEHKSVGEESLRTVKRFKEGHNLNMLPSTLTSVADNIAEEHGYAVTQRFISSNSYYGYHPVMTTGIVDDCSMDTSENTPNSVSNPDNTCGPTEWQASRKRSLEGGVEFDCDMSLCKRIRYEHVPETPPSCDPLPTSYQEPPQPQQLQLQLPGTMSYIAESVMPRPRCLMGHYV